MVTRFNLYHAIFSLMFVFKIGGLAEFSWLAVFLPLIVGSIHGYIYRLLTIIGVFRKAENAMLGIYIDSMQRQAVKRAIKDLKKEKV